MEFTIEEMKWVHDLIAQQQMPAGAPQFAAFAENSINVLGKLRAQIAEAEKPKPLAAVNKEG